MSRLIDFKHRVWRRAPVPHAVRRALWARRYPPSAFVGRHLDGLLGVEIGASAHNDYRLRAINIDRYADTDTLYKREELNLAGWIRPVDLVAPGDDLPLRDVTVDFVFASHVIEHFPDPIRALDEWCRVARTRVVLVVPHRDRTFDRDRPLTPLSELIERHQSGFTSDEDRHWTVWTCETFLELCDHLGFEVLEARDPDVKTGNGFALILSAAPAQRA